MPRKKARYRAALEVTTEWLRGPERPLDLPEGVPATIEVGIGSGHWVVARAKAEERRALAIAREQEMKAEVANNRPHVVLAEAEVPLAMAAAFREGNLGRSLGGNGSPS